MHLVYRSLLGSFLLTAVIHAVQLQSSREIVAEVQYMESGEIVQGTLNVKTIKPNLVFRTLRSCTLAMGSAATLGGIGATALLSPGENREIGMWIGMGGVTAALFGAGLFAIEPRKIIEVNRDGNHFLVLDLKKHPSIQARIIERLINESGELYPIFGKRGSFEASIKKIKFNVDRSHDGSALSLREFVAYVERPESAAGNWPEPLVPVKIKFHHFDTHTSFYGEIIEE